MERAFLRKFIKLYEGLPELWQQTNDFYHNKRRKHKCYERLLEKLKEVEPQATIDSVKKKINILRCSYRRELNKMKQSQKLGLDDDDVYKTSLWYFNDLNFLHSQETQKDENSMVELEDEDPLSKVSV